MGTFEEKQAHLKYLYSQQKNIAEQISQLQVELAKEGEPIRKIFAQKVQEIVDMIETIEGFSVVFNYQETSQYSNRVAKYSFVLSQTKNYQGTIRFHKFFTRKKPTTEKIINTKLKQIEKAVEVFGKRFPDFKQQLDKRKLALKLKSI